LLTALRSTTSSTVGRQGTFKKLIDINAALHHTLVASTPAAPTGPTPEQLAAAKLALQADVNVQIAKAQAEYDAAVKAAADKLAALKAAQLARLNG
jgi:hypothetical protein